MATAHRQTRVDTAREAPIHAASERNPGMPLELDWVRDVRDQCIRAGVPFFFKQWGGRTPKANGRELDGRTWDEMPRSAIGVEDGL